jgi:DNA polymerase sigma
MMTLVQSLAELEQTLTLWCMGVEPCNDDEVARFAEVVAARDRVSQLIHQLELHGAEAAANDLAVATSSIAQITQQIAATDKEVSRSRAIVDKVADAVQIAAQAAALVLGL